MLELAFIGATGLGLTAPNAGFQLVGCKAVACHLARYES